MPGAILQGQQKRAEQAEQTRGGQGVFEQLTWERALHTGGPQREREGGRGGDRETQESLEHNWRQIS